jgi:hypothetical protein
MTRRIIVPTKGPSDDDLVHVHNAAEDFMFLVDTYQQRLADNPDAGDTVASLYMTLRITAACLQGALRDAGLPGRPPVTRREQEAYLAGGPEAKAWLTGAGHRQAVLSVARGVYALMEDVLDDLVRDEGLPADPRLWDKVVAWEWGGEVPALDPAGVADLRVGVRLLRAGLGRAPRVRPVPPIEAWPVVGPTSADATPPAGAPRADSKADTPKKKRHLLPKSKDALTFIRRFNQGLNDGETRYSLALEIAENDETRAATILRSVRRYKHLLRGSA